MNEWMDGCTSGRIYIGVSICLRGRGRGGGRGGDGEGVTTAAGDAGDFPSLSAGKRGKYDSSRPTTGWRGIGDDSAETAEGGATPG